MNWKVLRSVLAPMGLVLLLVSCPGPGPGGNDLPAPNGLTALAVSASSISLSWTDNAGDEDGYSVERSLSSGSGFVVVRTLGPETESVTDSGLASSTNYYYRVAAFRSSETSGYSNTANATTQAPPSTPPAAPSGLGASALSSNSIRLTWTDNSNNETGFKIERSPNGSTGWTAVTTTTTGTTTYDNIGLTASTIYYYRVCATNGVGDSGWSNTANATTQAPPATLPAAPSGLGASALSSSSIRLTWTDNANNETGFKLQRSPNGSTSWTAVTTTAAGTTTYDNTSLTASTIYYYRVCATNGVGDSGWSNTANATTQAPLPAAPSGLGASALSSSSIRLTWTDNANNETGFKLQRSPNGSTSWTAVTTTAAGTTTYDNTSLTASTIYYYRICATNGTGDSGWSNTANATTQAAPDTQAPGVPTGLSATGTSTSQISLSWSASTDNVGVTGYEIYRGGVYLKSVTGTSTSDTGLGSGTTYGYQVLAYDAVGNESAKCTAVNGTTWSMVTLTPQYDNLIMSSSTNSSVENTVFQSGELAVGVNWNYTYYAGLGWYQDFIAGASLVKFNTSSLAGKTIESATLTLYVDYLGVGYYPQSWYIRALASSWSTTTITWNVFESTSYYTASQITKSAPTTYANVTTNLKTIVQNWASGAYANYGLSFTSSDYTFPYATSFDAFAFYSAEDTAGGKPQLTVVYH